ncbi:conserved Plasmodium protein, unknown function [Plasmodium gallinaceum]|uniref:Uncharacterized protein n=1 Tax=Plasmodium gallinaceum TaxID=5849 RepID=A0A1J1GRF4_PLAGA|nr:conserved Plasmodium protein, unknown function [Plasmodium gallinaceum]CRG95089.1 conserved Plasmodium protein, unknown function [Plasmodium gallinaceum]
MNNYSENDSDSTVEETLVMLNFPQLNNDENKLKNLNIFRKKKSEHPEKIPNSNNLPNQYTINDINGIEIDLTKDNNNNTEETLNNDIILNKNDNNVNCNSYDIQENNKQCNNREVQYKMNENVINSDSYMVNETNKELVDNDKCTLKKSESCLDNNIIDNIPFEVNSITLKNIFTENPQCVINDKYKFKGIQTSSIGTNLYFKEPESLKNKNDLKNYEISYDDYNRNIKNENKMTRDDFTIYEGYSTKIISFKIDY